MIKYPLEIFISFTTKCNLRCEHCYSKSSALGKTINVMKLLKISRKIKPLRMVISGGEPLVEIDKLIKFLTLYKKVYRIDSYIVLATNGIFLKNSNLKKLKSLIDRLQISLDTLSRRKFKLLRGIDFLNQTIKGIKNAKKQNFDVQLAFSIFKENINETKSIINFCIKNKIDKINVLRQRPLGRSIANVTPKEIKKVYLDFLGYSKNKKIRVNIHDPISNVLSVNSECIAAKEILAIDVDGNFKPCPLFNKSIKGDFDFVWNNSSFFKEVRKNVKDCKSCKIRLCNGGCKACSFNLFNKLKKDPWCIKNV